MREQPLMSTTINATATLTAKVDSLIVPVANVQKPMGQESRFGVRALQVYAWAWLGRWHIAGVKRLLVRARKDFRATAAAHASAERMAQNAALLRSSIQTAERHAETLRTNLHTWETRRSKTRKQWWHGPWQRNLHNLLAAHASVLVMLDDYTETLELSSDQPFLDWLCKEIQENA